MVLFACFFSRGGGGGWLTKIDPTLSSISLLDRRMAESKSGNDEKFDEKVSDLDQWMQTRSPGILLFHLNIHNKCCTRAACSLEPF